MAWARRKTAILIVGPTAVGKTSVAIELAKRFNTEIISADSRQCFKELNIGVARPTERELQTVLHYFVASHSIHDNVNAGTFEQYAIEKANELFHTHAQIIVSGGTGLYVKAFCQGLDAIPDVPNDTREEIISNYERNGLEWLQQQVRAKDPRFYMSGEIQNPHRLMRALEVAKTTGRSILEFRSGQKETRDFNIAKIGLELPKDEMHRNINARVDHMMNAGLVDEAKQLFPYKSLNALQTVGYAEIFDYLDGKVSLERAAELIKQNTRQYAKRQMTWFKKDKDIKWFRPSDITLIERYLVATDEHR
jgi:tRNA dimethylallyltransferase